MPARILVIEDDPDSLELMTYLLRAHGHAVWSAEDGKEGLRIVNSQALDLVVCDIQLPKLDGCQVALALKGQEETSALPLVAVTAFAMVGDRDRILSAGFNGYLTKPITAETFVPQVESYLPAAMRTLLLTQEESQETTHEHPPQEFRILVVDNNESNLEFERSLLEPNGFAVTTARSLREALSIVAEQTFDLVLSDVCMDDGTGYELLREIRMRDQGREIPVILITSTMMEPADRAKGLAMGAVNFLQRPLDADELLAHVRACAMRGKQTNA